MPLIPSKNPWEKRVVHLEGDLACVHCHYNLRGLPLSGRCPECGAIVWDSLLSKDIPALYRSVHMASVASFALAATAPLLCATLALESAARASPGPIVITTALAVLCLNGGTISWQTLPLWAFRPVLRERQLTWFILIAAVFSIGLGTVLCLTTTAAQAQWIGRAWDAALLCTSACFAIVLRSVGRMLYLLQMTGASRVILMVQVIAVICGIVSLASIAQEFLPEPGRLRATEQMVAAICGLLASVVLTIVAFRFRQYAAPALGE